MEHVKMEHEVNIEVVGQGTAWHLKRDSGLYWSTERNWVASVTSLMTFPLREQADTYLALNRWKMEKAEVQS